MGRKSIDPKYVKRLQKGDPVAFDEIFRFYKDSIYFFSLSLVKNQADAEEIVQETFIQVLNHIDTLEKPSSFHSWLHKIAYNQSMNLYKRNSRTVQLDNDFDLENIIEIKEGPASMLSNHELVSIVQTEIENMPDNLVRIAKLRYFDDFTTREIAEIMDIPEGTVKTRLNRVRKLIKPKLEKRGFSPAKYFSFAFTPIMFEAFRSLIESNPMSSEASARITENIMHLGAPLLAGIAAGGAASTASSTLQMVGKVAVATASGGATIYGAYQVVQPDSAYVEQIAYYNQYTNKNVEVEVLLSHGTSDVAVLYNENNVAFDLENDKLIFKAEANGEYNIVVGDDKTAFTLSNIDKTAPELLQVKKSEKNLNFQYSDTVSNIDYTKSYFISADGKKTALTKDGVIPGTYEGTIKVTLYDYAGNMSEYDVNLDSE